MAQTLRQPQSHILLHDPPHAMQRELRRVRGLSWGLLPVLCLLDGFALGVVALAGAASRSGMDSAPALLWIGLLMIFIPTALRLLSVSAARGERIGLVVLLGLALYLVKVLHSPLDFTFHDEFLHWQTVNNILRDGHLFSPNAILPVSASYPGMEVITSAFVSLSGLSVVESGVILLGIMRAAFMLAMFLFYERISGSMRLAGLATLLYTANSNFIYFDAQFSYESLALPIAMMILYAASMLDARRLRPFVLQFTLILPLIFLVTLTHHLTTYVLSGFLLVWTITTLLIKRKVVSWLPFALLTIITLASVVGWSSRVGSSSTVNYLAPVFRSGIGEIVSILINDGAGRELFQSAAGVASPVWERYVGFGAVAFILAGLGVGMIMLMQTLRRRMTTPNQVTLPPGATPVALALTLFVLLYPVMQLFRLTSSGWEIANRSSEFLFWAIAFVLAVAVLSIERFRIAPPFWLTGFAVWAAVVFVGGAISGWPPSLRLPAPYMVSADSRSIEPQGVLAAEWANNRLPPNSRISADRINTLLMSVYGQQRVITHLADDLYLASVFTAPHFGPSEVALITRADADFLVVDLRLSTELPLVGVYFEAGEPGGRQYTEPLSPEVLEKFDFVGGVSRIFDSGSIRIYDVRGIGLHGTP